MNKNPSFSPTLDISHDANRCFAAILLIPMLLAICLLLPGIAKADLASDLSAPGTSPQMRGLGVGTHYGRMPNWDLDATLPLLKQMGVQWVRDSWGWGGIEKTKGVYVMPPTMEHRLDVFHKAGIKVIAVLAFGNNIYDNPLDPDAFANWAAWMAKTCKGKVAVWEIWNEPDNFYFYKAYGGDRDGRDDAWWVTKHSELIRKATAAIKKVDPQAVVIHNMEGASWGMALRNHASDYAQTDGVDVHPYPARFPAESAPYGPENLKEGVLPTANATHSLVSVLDYNCIVYPKQSLGHPVDCWVGECGFSTYHPAAGKKIHFAPVSEPLQAAYQVRSVLTGLVYGVKAWCIYDFIDETPDDTDVESRFGLVRDVTRKYEPKPAFYALQRMARLLGPDWQLLPNINATLHAEVTQPPDANPWIKVNGPVAHWFRVGDKVITIVWKAGESDLNAPPALGSLVWRDAPVGTTVEAVDLVSGRSVDLKTATDASGLTLSKLPVGWAPVAIRWNVPAEKKIPSAP